MRCTNTVLMRTRPRPVLVPSPRRIKPSYSTSEPGKWYSAEYVSDQPADGLHLVEFEFEIEQFTEVFDGKSRGYAEHSVTEILDGRRLVLVVFVGDLTDDLFDDVLDRDEPAIPPYSSTSIAMWLRSRCISASKLSSGFESGTKTAGRMTSQTLTFRPPSGRW